MASPNEASVQSQISAAVKILDEVMRFGSVNPTNLITLENDLITKLEGDFSAQVATAMDSLRANVAAAQSAEIGQGLLSPLFLLYGQLLDTPQVDIPSIFRELRRYQAAGAVRVKSRAFTFGTPAAGGSNVGNGALYRCNKDRFAFDLENQTPDTKLAFCTGDVHSGTPLNREVFRLRGGTARKDTLKIEGSGKVLSSLVAIDEQSTEQLITNPSFTNISGDPAAPSEIAGWTPSNIAVMSMKEGQGEVYRYLQGQETPRAVEFSDNATLTQRFVDVQAQFSPDLPYFYQVAYNPLNGADGTLRLSLGGKNVTVTVSGSGWKTLVCALDETLWLEQWNQTNAGIEIEWSGRSAGQLRLDDVLVAPMVPFDGSYYALVGGQTAFLVDDQFTFGDSEAGAILQAWFWRSFGEYLLADATPTWVDP